MTRPIGVGDAACGFRCGKHTLDDYFARHALPNDQAGIGRAYIVEASSEDIASAVSTRLPRYPMPVALIGRLAVDERARGRRLGEALLIDALRPCFRGFRTPVFL